MEFPQLNNRQGNLNLVIVNVRQLLTLGLTLG